MKMKACTKCKLSKPLNDFYTIVHKGIQRLKAKCRRCHYLDARDYQKAHPWLSSYHSARTRCVNSGHEAYHRYGGRGIKLLMTTSDFKKLWFRDNASSMMQPSIDRKDNDKNYTVTNCRFIEKVKNTKHLRIPWNKGLTKETDFRVAEYGKNSSITKQQKTKERKYGYKENRWLQVCFRSRCYS